MRTPRSLPGPRRTVFWKVAAVLVGVQVATGLLAVGLSAYLSEARSLELVRNSLILRLDSVAEEVEARADFVPDSLTSRAVLPSPLRTDLAARFPDPVFLVDAGGLVIGAVAEAGAARPAVPGAARRALAGGRIEVDLAADSSWAVAPIYDRDGVPAGGLLVYPLTASIERERAGTRAATRRALWIVGLLALASALVLGAFVTAWLVGPLRRMTQRVEAIGAGDYEDRLSYDGADEVGRLAASINAMAAQVEASISALRATDRLRRELVASIGHDLRTPLAALRGYLEEAQRLLEEEREGEASEALAIAELQGQQVEALVRDLFELSVLEEAGSPALRREPVPPAELLHEAARTQRPRFEENGLALVVETPAELPTVAADGVRLLRVLGNLLDNARRHTPPGGTVRLTVESDSTTLYVRVADTGEGIAPDALDHLFERYYRGDAARTRGATGSGLGLAISRAIARAHGGELTVESTVGQGSTFTLTIPLTD